VALGLQADGWILRQVVYLCKRTAMPDPVRDRPTSAVSQLFLFARQGKYFYDQLGWQEPAAEGGLRQPRNFWLLGSSAKPAEIEHFATFSPELVRRAVLLGTSEQGVCAACGAPWRRLVARERLGGWAVGPAPSVVRSAGWEPGCRCGAGTLSAVVLDPFSGSGTTCLVARRLGRRALGLELNTAYVEASRERLRADQPLLNWDAGSGEAAG
jgi:hypothetical protein